jgi:hypothetical protein
MHRKKKGRSEEVCHFSDKIQCASTQQEISAASQLQDGFDPLGAEEARCRQFPILHEQQEPIGQKHWNSLKLR